MPAKRKHRQCLVMAAALHNSVCTIQTACDPFIQYRGANAANKPCGCPHPATAETNPRSPIPGLEQNCTSKKKRQKKTLEPKLPDPIPSPIPWPRGLSRSDHSHGLPSQSVDPFWVGVFFCFVPLSTLKDTPFPNTVYDAEFRGRITVIGCISAIPGPNYRMVWGLSTAMIRQCIPHTLCSPRR